MKSDRKSRWLLLLALTVIGGSMVYSFNLYGSDHDDGETNLKGRALNLTDLYVFRERDQDSGVATNDLIFIMNVNPRSLARQQYYFATNALYQFHVARVAAQDSAAGTSDDVVMRFQFGTPDANKRQTILATMIKSGSAVGETNQRTGGNGEDGTTFIKTTPLKQPEPTTVAAGNIHNFTLGGTTFTVFAGHRQDAFFFDVEQYFRVRAGALGTGPAASFRPTSTAADFTIGYNVLSIVLRVPRAFLQTGAGETVFDCWETIWVPQ